MSNPVWGQLAKALDDQTTILQAIASLIATHNSDGSAHLGPGGSLQTHAASEIIDHLAESVVRDKLKFDRFQIDDSFFTLDAWGKTDGVELLAVSAVQILTAASSSDFQRLSLGDLIGGSTQANRSQNPVWETGVIYNQITNQISYVGQISPEDQSGFGFKIVNATVYCVYFDHSGAEHLTSVSTITAGSLLKLRCEVPNGTDVNFYVDGNLVLTITAIACDDVGDFMLYTIQPSANQAKTMWVRFLHFDANFSED